METYEIEAFLTVAEELHFGRSAERLGVSTGRVSQIIRKLERRVGAALFDRTSRLVTLTTIGTLFHDDLRPGHEQVQRALERAIMAARGFEGPLRVGFLGAAAGALVLETARAYRAEHPTGDVIVHELQMDNCFTELREHRTEMVLNTRPVTEPDMVAGPALWSEPRYLAVSARHRLAARSEIRLEDLARVTLLRMPANAPAAIADDRVPAATPQGRPIAHGPRVASFQEALALIAADEGAFTVGGQVIRFYTRPDVTYVPICDAPPIEWGFVWRASHETARIRAFNAKAVAVRTPSRRARGAAAGAL
ncbi:LysR family transcriptional regulator (plasmid) [Embleya sp. NBC_00888]|uniref:LysR family transcriptional regulator n=1 Tax=Embleya sp. NBC_00888 TaxID=2975960 RepID=UPI002F90DF4D|nr:LysR family transcriptional regulator [Embleya sp. NBC_00888]